jgi:hypothetical protein
MVVNVVTKFIDKYTKKLYLPGDCIEVSKERFAELTAAGKFVEAVLAAEDAEPEEDKDETGGVSDAPDTVGMGADDDGKAAQVAGEETKQATKKTTVKKTGTKKSAKK